MSISWDRLKKINEQHKFRKNAWPHQFVKDGPGEIVGEQGDLPIVYTPMICSHCYKRFVAGRDPRPPELCPARTDRRELGRILG